MTHMIAFYAGFFFGIIIAALMQAAKEEDV